MIIDMEKELAKNKLQQAYQEEKDPNARISEQFELDTSFYKGDQILLGKLQQDPKDMKVRKKEKLLEIVQ